METRKEILIGMFLVFVSLVILFFGISGYLSKNIKSVVKTASISSSDVAKHNTESDCWIIINNEVLFVSPYLNLHPGGKESIASLCGQDTTIPFNTKGGKGKHSIEAIKMLNNFLVGKIIVSK